MIALRKTPLSDVQPGDILLRQDTDMDRAVLIGEFVEWILPYGVMKVYNPADSCYNAVIDMETASVLVLGEGGAK